jgi:ell wall binding domain 2 (CWB2)
MPSKIVVVGGTGAVSGGIAAKSTSLAASVVRVAGGDRYETSAALAGAWKASPHAYLASGDVFPDALVGSALAGKHGEPLYVMYPGCQADALAASLKNLGTTDVTAIGGLIGSDDLSRMCYYLP